MIVYQADKKQFLHDNDDREIDEIIRLQFLAVTGKTVGASELQSWRESLSYMAKVLHDQKIPSDVGVAIEFHIPQSAKRMDFILTGLDVNRSKNLIIIELKQWSQAQVTDKDAIVKTYLGNGQREVVHPSYQAWSYASLLEGFNTAVYDGHIKLRPCAYLHNYVRDGAIDSAHYAHYINKAPLFLKGESERKLLREFITQHINTGDGGTILDEIDHAEIRPSKALADSLVKLMKGNPEFVMIDDQKTVFEAALAVGQSATAANSKVLIVEGGPGTGKTVLAINLLVALTAKGLICKYVSKNAAPRRVYETKLSGVMARTEIGNLFSSSGSFMETANNSFDVLIVDEAHRLNEKSGFYGNQGDNQVKEIISSAKCTIFFIDEDQRVTLNDVGSKELIKTLAIAKGASLENHSLASQFRCSGSDGYLAWLDNTLGVRETANTKLSQKEFDFRVFDSPTELHEFIEGKNGGNKARVVAGYCWPWTSKRDPAAFDIKIGNDYRKRWNLDTDGSLWIITPSSIDEVGCIHTCQGLELDCVGVIIGPDLVVRDGKIQTIPEKRARHDQSLKGYKSLLKTDPVKASFDADLIIKNTYRTLMTRGMKGCYIFCTDVETSEYFKNLIS